MKALEFDRNVVRYAAARAAGALQPGSGARYGPLRLTDVDLPELPGDGWVRLRPRLCGICGSDLATIDGKSSRYFEPIVSFPFVPGHEVVGDLDADADGSAERMVLEPVLGCATRNVTPPCRSCAEGRLGNCEQIAFGDLEPGLQSGFCCDTGGGWSTLMLAHRSQLHPVPETMSDETAVMVEPLACAIHGALAAGVDGGDTVVVVGAGALGLLTTLALRRLTEPGVLVVAAKHPHQREEAERLGADVVVSPDKLKRGVRRTTHTMAVGSGDGLRLTGGADIVVDCVGSADSLAESLAVVRPHGRVVLLGMPGRVSVDLTGLWHREIDLVGAYAYGTEQRHNGSPVRTFDLALDLAAEADVGRLVTTSYPLGRYEEALTHAGSAGSRGAVKIAFDLRDEKERTRL